LVVKQKEIVITNRADRNLAGADAGLHLTRSQKTGLALLCIVAIVLALVLAVVLISPVLNVLGLQAIGS